MKPFPPLNEATIKQIDFSAEMIDLAALTAAGLYDESVGLDLSSAPESVDDVEESGARFVIPLVLPEGIASGDGRIFASGALTTRDLPLPLMWQIKTGPGHDGSVIVGRIDTIDYTELGLVNARGVFDTGKWGREAERLVRSLFLRGISGDLDEFEASSEKSDNDELSDKESIKNRKITIDKARLMGVTLVAKPAFQECFIMIEQDPVVELDESAPEDGLYEDVLDDLDNEFAALAASAAPMVPPRNWFQNPGLSAKTPLTVDDDGRVFGHIATWGTQHIGYGRKTNPPRSSSNYAYFRTGVVRTDDGTDVTVGQLTLAGGHASMYASADQAVKHYDDTASAVADVNVGEDRYGIWVAGALRPDITPSQVRALRASAPSGDWRPIGNKLELVAVCQVNVPGFPTVRAMVAGGQITALVAAGARPLAEMREASKIEDLERRIAMIEAGTFSAEDSVIEEEVPAESQFADKAAELAQRVAAIKASAKKSEKVEDEPIVEPALSALAASAADRVAAIRNAQLAAKAEKLRARMGGVR